MSVSGHSEETVVEEEKPKPSKLGLGRLEREEQEKNEKLRLEQEAQAKQAKRQLLSDVARRGGSFSSNVPRSSEVEEAALAELFRQKVCLKEDAKEPTPEQMPVDPADITKITPDQIHAMRSKRPPDSPDSSFMEQIYNVIIRTFCDLKAYILLRPDARATCRQNGRHQCGHCGTKIYVQNDGKLSTEAPLVLDGRQALDSRQANVSASH